MQKTDCKCIVVRAVRARSRPSGDAEKDLPQEPRRYVGALCLLIKWSLSLAACKIFLCWTSGILTMMCLESFCFDVVT